MQLQTSPMAFSFSMQMQTETNWCWAATATSISLFYHKDSKWTQCTLANAEKYRTDCCTVPDSSYCNVYGYLDTSLTTVGCFASQIDRSATPAQTYPEMQAQRPVGLRIAWIGGGAHFIVMHGLVWAVIDYTALLKAFISDSIYGESLWTLAEPYRGTGAWTNTYFTKG